MAFKGGDAATLLFGLADSPFTVGVAGRVCRGPAGLACAHVSNRCFIRYQHLHQVSRISYKRVASRDWSNTHQDRHRRSSSKLINIKELTQSQFVVQDKFIVFIRQ